jgi:nitroimidazol reductase NimA-like FMN-containing flavoprotein (pyridoxamine 5'-phosphate oxidase superfamily)
MVKPCRKESISTVKKEMIENRDRKREALAIIVSQYSSKPHSFTQAKLRATAVFEVAVESMTGKQSGFDQP